MGEHPIDGLMNTTISKIRDMVDVNTIIGDAITAPDGTIIIPVSKVVCGFASGGADLPTKTAKNCFGGGSGAGVTIQPVAFLTVYKGNVKLIPVDKYDGAADRVVAMVPDLVDKVTELFKKDKPATHSKNTDSECADPDEQLF